MTAATSAFAITSVPARLAYSPVKAAEFYADNKIMFITSVKGKPKRGVSIKTVVREPTGYLGRDQQQDFVVVLGPNWNVIGTRNDVLTSLNAYFAPYLNSQQAIQGGVRSLADILAKGTPGWDLAYGGLPPAPGFVMIDKVNARNNAELNALLKRELDRVTGVAKIRKTAAAAPGFPTLQQAVLVANIWKEHPDTVEVVNPSDPTRQYNPQWAYHGLPLSMTQRDEKGKLPKTPGSTRSQGPASAKTVFDKLVANGITNTKVINVTSLLEKGAKQADRAKDPRDFYVITNNYIVAVSKDLTKYRPAALINNLGHALFQLGMDPQSINNYLGLYKQDLISSGGHGSGFGMQPVIGQPQFQPTVQQFPAAINYQPTQVVNYPPAQTLQTGIGLTDVFNAQPQNLPGPTMSNTGYPVNLATTPQPIVQNVVLSPRSLAAQQGLPRPGSPITVVGGGGTPTQVINQPDIQAVNLGTQPGVVNANGLSNSEFNF